MNYSWWWGVVVVECPTFAQKVMSSVNPFPGGVTSKPLQHRLKSSGRLQSKFETINFYKLLQ